MGRAVSWWLLAIEPPTTSPKGGLETFAVCRAGSLGGAIRQLPRRMRRRAMFRQRYGSAAAAMGAVERGMR